MCFGGGGDDGGAAEARAAEEQRKNRILQGTSSIDTAFSGFDDAHFEGLRKAFLDFGEPQLSDDVFEAKKNLNFALQRTGLSASTAAGGEQAKLARQADDARAGLLSAADQFVREARSDTERARAELLSQLQSTEDPAAAASAAVRRASSLSEAPSFQPLPKFVFDASRGLERVSEAQGFKPVVSSSLFSRGGRGSSTVVN